MPPTDEFCKRLFQHAAIFKRELKPSISYIIVDCINAIIIYRGKTMYELIILSLLMREPLHGYLIAKIINDMIGPIAKVSHGWLYQ